MTFSLFQVDASCIELTFKGHNNDKFKNGNVF